MGAWGIKQIESDDGLDFITGRYLEHIKNKQGRLNVDEALMETFKHLNDIYKEDVPNYRLVSMYISMGELIYYYKINKAEANLGRLFSVSDYYPTMVVKIVSSKKSLNRIIKMINTELVEIEAGKSGWFPENIEPRMRWLKEIRDVIWELIQSKDDPVVIYEKIKACPEVLEYTNDIKWSNNHDLNRLRLFIANEINEHIGYGHKNRGLKKPYYTVDTFKGKAGEYYRLFFHDTAGKYKMIAKGKTVEEILTILLEYSKPEYSKYQMFGITDLDLVVWNFKYNKEKYMLYVKSRKNKH